MHKASGGWLSVKVEGPNPKINRLLPFGIHLRLRRFPTRAFLLPAKLIMLNV